MTDLGSFCGIELVKHEQITEDNVLAIGLLGENSNFNALINKCVELIARNMAKDWTEQIKSSSKFMVTIIKMFFEKVIKILFNYSTFALVNHMSFTLPSSSRYLL